MQFKVSVIMPVYNESHFLPQALRAFASQSIAGDCELICIDDGSTDGSLQILKKCADSGGIPNIRIERQENLGFGAARNRGLDAAQGEFVGFLDADDLYPADDTLETLYEVATTHSLDAAGGSLELLENGRRRRYKPTSEEPAGQVFDFDCEIQPADYQFGYGFYRFIFRRSRLEENGVRFPDFIRFQDPPFFVRALDATERFYALRRATYLYRYNPKKIAWDHRKALDLLKGIDNVAAYATDKSYDRLLRDMTFRLCHDFGGVFRDVIVRDHDISLLQEYVTVREKMRERSNRMGLDMSELFENPNVADEALRAVDELAVCRAELEDSKARYNALRSNMDALAADRDKLRAECDALRAEQEALLASERKARADADAVRDSLSFKAGRVLTFVPRRVRDVVRPR